MKAEAIARALLGADSAWLQLYSWRGIILLSHSVATETAPFVLPHNCGFVFGPLFTREEEVPSRLVEALDYDEAVRLCRSGGAGLVADYWGSYLAVLVDREKDAVHIVRDPMGARTAFIAREDELYFCAADIADLALCTHCKPVVERVAHFLAYPYLSSRDTGLNGVEEILPGEALSLSREDAERRMLWRPPQAARPRATFDACAIELRRVVADCVGAWARLRPQILHRLSGGLDSSITLAVLVEAAGKNAVTCINDASSEAPEGDERAFARLAAKACGVQLEEVAIDAAGVDFSRLFDAPLSAVPARGVLGFADLTHATRFGAMSGRNDVLLTSGQGGDHIFHRVRTPLIAADAVRLGEPPSRWASIIYDTARLTGESFWRVAQVACGHGLMRRPIDLEAQFDPRAANAHDEVWRAAIGRHMDHPWLAEWRRRPANEVRRVSSLLHALHYHVANPFARLFHCAPVLLSQPIVEFAMRLPGHVLTHQGKERSLFRAAFADMAPAPILNRATKGETTRHFAAVVRNNRTLLREALIDGELVAAGLLEQSAVRTHLDAIDRIDLDALARVLNFFAAEVWLRSWASRQAAPRAQCEASG